MKFTLVTAILPVLAAAASTGQRAEARDGKLPVVDTSKIDNFSGETLDADKIEGGADEVTVAGSWYCDYGFWCYDSSPSCCPNSCCQPGTDFCGSDGHCYRWT